jgi:hypothetical protein
MQVAATTYNTMMPDVSRYQKSGGKGRERQVKPQDEAASDKSPEVEAKTYDFTNITPERLLDVMNSLIREGKMTLDESSALMRMIPSPKMPELFAPNAFTRPINVFEKLKQGLAFAEYRHDENAKHFYQLTLDAVQKLQGTPKGVDVRG